MACGWPWCDFCGSLGIIILVANQYHWNAAFPRAGGESSATSNGLVVDHTPPELINITTKDSAPFQQQDDVLHFIWDFHDPESGVAEYRCVVTESHQGVLNDNFWPGSVDFHVVSLNATSGTSGELSLEGLRLKNGGRYRLRVTALNRANMATAEESNSVTVDTTPPEILQVLTSFFIIMHCYG